jgi:hypothetical protein
VRSLPPAESNSSPGAEGMLFEPEGPPSSESLGGGSSEGGNRTRQQRITGVGGRLALGEFGVLFSTERSVFGGSDLPLGGVRTAALGRITIISGVKENPVLIALNRKSIEPQLLKYAVIPNDTEVNTSELEVLRGGAVFKTIVVQLVGGRGQTTLPEGFDYPEGVTTTARLVVNRAEEPKPTPMARTLRVEAFEVLPTEPTTLAVLHDVDVAGVSQSVLERLGRGSSAPTLSWAITGGTGARVVPALDTPATGRYVTQFKAGALRDVSYQVELRKGDVLLGRSAPITTTAGLAERGFITVEAPAYRTGTSGLVPADGTSEITVRVKNIRDALDNTLEDGTPVRWFVEGDAGQILDPETALVGGEAITRYRAGTEPGSVRIWAAIDEKEYDLNPPLEQVPLVMKIERKTTGDPFTVELEATVDSEAGLPAFDTPISWSQTYGLLAAAQVVRGGTSTALWSEPDIALSSGSYPLASVFASVGRSRAANTFLLPSVAGSVRTRVSLDHYRLVDGEEGSPFPRETAVHVKGEPGAQVRLLLGSTRQPAMLPIGAFSLDVLDPQGAADAYGGPRAEVGDGVSSSAQQPKEGLASYHFTGTGGLTLSEGDFRSLTQDFGLSGYVRFDSLEPGQRIIEKAGSYRSADLDYLQLYDLSRASFLSFPGGGTSVNLTLDSEGRADTVVTLSGVLFAPMPGARQLQDVPIQTDVDLDPPPGVVSESFGAPCGSNRRHRPSNARAVFPRARTKNGRASDATSPRA